jgi:thiamine-phosphate pyrophosphorylase
VQRTLIDFRLYLITDRKLFADNSSFYDAIEQALAGGVEAVQLREKDLAMRGLLDMAYRLRELTGSYDARLFVNDRVDVALAVKADGVHLGGSSLPAGAARRIAGEKFLIGVSTHGIEEAETAEKEGADFITVGPVYATPSKMKYGKPLGPGILGKIKEKTSVPVFAIGGIKQEKIGEVLGSGADGIALISAVLTAREIKSTTETFMRLLK